MSGALAPGLALGGALAALAIAAALVVPWGCRPAAAAPCSIPEQQDRAVRFHTALRPLRRARVVVGLAVPLILGLTPAGAALVRLLPGPGVARLALTVLLLVGLPWLCALPISLRVRRLVNHVGLSRQRARSWWLDQAKAGVLSLGVSMVVLGGILALQRDSPQWWWAELLLLALLLVPISAVLLPPVAERLFNRFAPMPDGPVRTGAVALIVRAGVRVRRVLVADASRRTTALNAYVSGLGPTRRVVVYDTVLSSTPAPEVLSVLGHELGHARHRDVLRGIVLGVLGTGVWICATAVLLSFPPLRAMAGVRALGTPECAPLLLALATLASFVTSPLHALVSRRLEARADEFALDTTGDPVAFIAVYRRMAATNLEDVAPSRSLRAWYGTHPTTPQRIGAALLWAARAAAADPATLSSAGQPPGQPAAADPVGTRHRSPA